MIKLDDQVALVTGAARGIGRACAQMLALAGARVAVNYRAADAQARALVDEILESGGEARAYRADVSVRSEVDRMTGEVRADLGPIDILVANAGICPPESRPAEELSEAGWKRTLDVNLTGMWHCCRGVIPEMKRRRRGRIILISYPFDGPRSDEVERSRSFSAACEERGCREKRGSDRFRPGGPAVFPVPATGPRRGLATFIPGRRAETHLFLPMPD